MNEKQNLIPLENPNPAVLFVPGGLDDLLGIIEDDARTLVPDVTTKRGREEIASTAMRVARSKTYLDDLGREYVSELKRMPRQVDEVRRNMRNRLDLLRDEVRKPLTDWENEQNARQAAILERMAIFRKIPDPGISSLHLGQIIAEIEAVGIDETYFGDMVAEANIARAALLYRLGKFRDIALSMEKKHETKIHSEIVRAMNSIVVNAETGVRINGVHCSMIVDAIVSGDIAHLKIEY